MLKIPLVVQGILDVQSQKNFAEGNIPFAIGQCFDASGFSIQDEQNNSIACQYRILSKWHDGSIKWLTFFVELPSKLTAGEQLYLVPANTETLNTIALAMTNNKASIDTGTRAFSLACDKNFGIVLKAKDNSKTLGQIHHYLTLPNSDVVTWALESLEGECYDSPATYTQSLLVKGKLVAGKHQFRFESRYHFFNRSSQVKIEFTLHNHNAAEHRGGLWDLGEANSFVFESSGFEYLGGEVDEFIITDELSDSIVSAKESIVVRQLASGGDNWQSPVHQNAQGEVPLNKNGFEIKSEADFIEGLRISPTLISQNASHWVACYIEQFWQNFPTALSADCNAIKAELFPKGSYELQPGEKKTHSLWFDFDVDVSKNDERIWQSSVKLVPEASQVFSSQAIPFYSSNLPASALVDTIALGLDGDNNFFAKREVVDEYGWRNFGDLYADHEAENHNEPGIFVSHYNNQYDALFGLLAQHTRTNDGRWFELADDLARHIKDIDIYHTVADREEYNQGLFWHTDHYLPAATCTHRTFSKHHQAVYEGYTSGGGPGPQHCYTSGLMLHHFLTGSKSSKECAVNLAHWISNNFEGAPGVLSKLVAIKKSYQLGVKNHITGQYPLDRGTGHYVVAQLDAFELTGKDSYISKASDIIANTIHPLDDIAQRGLDNIELTWFYTVFLQAVGRFLLIKEQLAQYDNSFFYARDALIHYADWMVKNEAPYLSQVEKLEFPTTTWIAQDLRKVAVFRLAHYFMPEQSTQFNGKAEEFLAYVQKAISEADNNDSTRVLVLLMQNINMSYFGLEDKSTSAEQGIRTYQVQQAQNKYIKIVKLVFKELMRFSLKREIRWLSLRSAKCKNMFGKYVNETN